MSLFSWKKISDKQTYSSAWLSVSTRYLKTTNWHLHQMFCITVSPSLHLHNRGDRDRWLNSNTQSGMGHVSLFSTSLHTGIYSSVIINLGGCVNRKWQFLLAARKQTNTQKKTKQKTTHMFSNDWCQSTESYSCSNESGLLNLRDVNGMLPASR